MNRIHRLTRREALQLGFGSAAGLVLGVRTEGQTKRPAGKTALQASALHSLGAFVQITTQGDVLIACSRPDSGQGVRTSLAMLVAEELDADWTRTRVIQAPFDRKYGPMDVAGSSSVRSRWTALRQAGAVGRSLLVEAAAKQWSVNASECTASRGVVTHPPSLRKAQYGQLVAGASKLPAPQSAPLKKASEFHIIGKSKRAVDTPAKVRGTAVFGMDVRVPGMLYAVVARCPVFGGKVAKFKPDAALKVKGVQQVFEIPSGIAVVADNTWTAARGRDALEVEWHEGLAAAESSASIRAGCVNALAEAKTLRTSGSAPASGPNTLLEAVYEVPFQAHAALEPLSCTVDVRPDRCEIWASTQFPSTVHADACRLLNLPKEAVKLNIPLLGGAFGRGTNSNFASEALEVGKRLGKPVKVVHMREDDIRHDYYRPASLHKVSVGLDADSKPVSWTHTFASPSIWGYYDPKTPMPQMTETDGAIDMPYAFPHVQVKYAYVPSGVPRGFWRSVAHTPNAWVVECMIDEIAAATKQDPLRLRLDLLTGAEITGLPPFVQKPDAKRLRSVLELASDKANWGRPMPPRSGRGIAVHASFGSYCAQVAEVAVDNDGNVKVTRFVCAIDCGFAVNPDGVRAQMEGGIAFGLTAALKGAITIDQGRVKQSNFHDYPMLRINEMPAVEVHLIQGSEELGGVGETGVPPAAPALCNAIFSATGKRVRKLPIRTRDLRV